MSKYILITGGELFNKGAQSMTFITVNEIKSRFPDKRAVLLSARDFDRKESDKQKYTFDILPFNAPIASQLLGGFFKFLFKLKSSKNINKYKSYIEKLNEVFKNSEAIIDISGYALSSQFGKGSSLGYIMRIMLAKKYKIKMYIMPQSFGPFRYKGISKYLLKYMLNKYLKYPEVIYTREKEGYEILKKNFNLPNLKQSYDLVLLNKGINYSNIYRNIPEIKEFEDINGVAIVPNMKNFVHGNVEEIMSLYEIVIKKLINYGKKVYLIRHSYEDLKACKMIKERFHNNDQVIMIAEDMSCLEFDKLVKKFKFIIGSRFHSIIHAYKNAVPCIALGWATKYHELLKLFNQEDYIFDVRNNINFDNVSEALDKMINNYNDESKVIKLMLQKINKSNIFDVLED